MYINRNYKGNCRPDPEYEVFKDWYITVDMNRCEMVGYECPRCGKEAVIQYGDGNIECKLCHWTTIH